VFIGSLDRQTDQWIPSEYFDVPRALADEDNSISTDLAITADDPRWRKQFDAEVENRPQPWLSVRVDGRWFIDWLACQRAPRAEPDPKSAKPSAQSRTEAIAERLRQGEQPGVTVMWARFCDRVRDDCGGWDDRKARRPKRGFGDKSIKRAVARQRP
jgi:hypothetical protein